MTTDPAVRLLTERLAELWIGCSDLSTPGTHDDCVHDEDAPELLDPATRRALGAALLDEEVNEANIDALADLLRDHLPLRCAKLAGDVAIGLSARGVHVARAYREEVDHA